MLQIGARLNEGAARFAHFLAVHGQKPVAKHAAGLAIARAFQHRRPEEHVEIGNILADEMVELGAAVCVPEIGKIEIMTRTQGLESGHIAHRRIHPDIKIFARLARNFKAPVRRIAGNIPRLQTGSKPFRQFVAHRFLDMGIFQPLLQKAGKARQIKEEMLGIAQDRRRPGQHGIRRQQIGGRICRAAHFAVVAVLVFGLTFRTRAFDKAIGQKELFFRVIELGNGFAQDMAALHQTLIHITRPIAIFFAMGAVILMMINQKA